MRKVSVLLAATIMLALVAANAFAQSIPSAKATAAVDELVSLAVVTTDAAGGPVSGPWTTILSQQIKTSNMKDLFIDVSLETGLYTRTLVRSKDAVT